MLVSLVVAMAENRVIGSKGKLPWHLPGDLAHFKQVTMGKPVIMGRKTFESIGHPLSGRFNVVITRDLTYKPQQVCVVHGLSDALVRVKDAGLDLEAMIIGGAQIYDIALPIADRIYLTEVHDSITGDILFPPLVPHEWYEKDHKLADPGTSVSPAYSFVLLNRKTS